MPVPFRELDDVEDLGSAAYLKVQRSADGACVLGALFVMSARGEPLEFAYNRVRVPNPFLWRAEDLRQHTDRRLAISLLAVCTHLPRLLLGLAEEVDALLFRRTVQVEMPVALVGPPPIPTRRVDRETGEILEDPTDAPHVTWLPAPPEPASAERRLFDHLAASGLLDEPFERAALGLREVYGPSPCGPLR